MTEWLRPGSPGYDEFRAPPNARFADVHPEAVVRCTTTEDVAAAVREIATSGRTLSVRSGGHCFAGRSSHGQVIVDVEPLDDIAVDGDIVRVGGGVRQGALYDAVDAAGRAVPGGNGSTVGLSGVVLGGGLGILGRKYGLACDNLRSAQVVLSDGRVVECSNDSEPDLFWALRGAGGGRFGVVTGLTLATVPAPTTTAFELTWPVEHAATVLRAWQRHSPDAPDELAASLLITASDDLGDPPRVTVGGTIIGASADDALAPLLAAIDVEPHRTEPFTAGHRDVKRHLEPHDINVDHVTYLAAQFHREPWPDAAVAALVEHLAAARVDGQARELDFTPWAGAYCRPAPDATAFPHRRERFLLKHSAVVPAAASPDERDRAHRWAHASHELVVAYGSGGATGRYTYPNFPDPDLDDPSTAYFAGNVERLRDVQRRYDPLGVFDAV